MKWIFFWRNANESRLNNVMMRSGRYLWAVPSCACLARRRVFQVQIFLRVRAAKNYLRRAARASGRNWEDGSGYHKLSRVRKESIVIYLHRPNAENSATVRWRFN